MTEETSWVKARRMYNNYRILHDATDNGDPKKEFFKTKMQKWRKIMIQVTPGHLLPMDHKNED